MLKSLVVVTDEHKRLRSLLYGRSSKIEWHDALQLGPQTHLPMMNIYGMADLRALRGLQNVEFRHPEQTEQQGSVPGGFLETVAKCEMMQSADMQAYVCPLELSLDGHANTTPRYDHSAHGPFRFFDLPPEVRNIVYDMLMANPGVTFPDRGRPTSVKHLHHSKRSVVLAPSSVLDFLCVSRQVHDEAEGVFYSRNDLVFTTPAGLQSFISTLGPRRLDALRSLTFFYKESRVGNKADGLPLMEATLSILRFLRGLRKLHILVPEPEPPHGRWKPVPHDLDWTQCHPAQLEGASYLFKFRNLEDLQVFGPHSVRRQDHTGEDVVAGVKELDAIFRHFNHGLRLAQEGRIFSELYMNESWADRGRWPALGTETSICGPRNGCLCGMSSDDDGSK